MSETVLRVEHLKKYYPVRRAAFSGEVRQVVRACDDVSFELHAGEVLGIVGESGCGKSTTMQSVIRLIEPTDGRITLCGQDFRALKGRALKQARQRIKLIFQDPYSSLNPRMCVADLIADPMQINHLYPNRQERYKRVAELMDTVGLAKRVANAYPHELDGGRRQRIGVARALAVNPEFIVCDEPVSALDVSIQAQILNLLMDLQDEMGLTYMFVTHDLSVVKHISTNIMVTYLGKCVEIGTSDQIFENPSHPYTKALLAALPEATLEARGKEIQLLRGEIGNPINPKPGCRFASRCPYCTEACTQGDIPEQEVAPGHRVACLLPMGEDKR